MCPRLQNLDAVHRFQAAVGNFPLRLFREPVQGHDPAFDKLTILRKQHPQAAWPLPP
jgi:hypothetical protein